jgi:hypothetical protein
MTATQTFRELTYTMRPQDPHGDGTGLRFETGEHGGDYPDNMPQAITVTDVQGRWAVYVPLRVNGKIVVPQTAVDSAAAAYTQIAVARGGIGDGGVGPIPDIKTLRAVLR